MAADEERLRAAELGRRASQSLPFLQEAITAVETSTLQNAANQLRAGSLTGEQALAAIGGISALQQVELHLIRTIKRGQTADQEEREDDG